MHETGSPHIRHLAAWQLTNGTAVGSCRQRLRAAWTPPLLLAGTYAHHTEADQLEQQQHTIDHFATAQPPARSWIAWQDENMSCPRAGWPDGIPQWPFLTSSPVGSYGVAESEAARFGIISQSTWLLGCYENTCWPAPCIDSASRVVWFLVRVCRS